MSPEAERGRRIANTSGCASCHGADGTGGVGPALAGLYGSEVTLADGSTVVADDVYLRRSITDPDADLVEGYAVKMPVVGLDDDEIEAVLAYIRELGDVAMNLRAVNLRRAVAVAATFVTIVVPLASCGGDGGRELVGYTLEPAPQVDAVALPDVSEGR